MRVRLGLVCAIAVILALQLTHAAAGGGVILARKYKAGSVFHIRVETDIVTSDEDSDTDTENEEEEVLVKTVGRDGTVRLAKDVDVHLDLGRSLLVKVPHARPPRTRNHKARRLARRLARDGGMMNERRLS